MTPLRWTRTPPTEAGWVVVPPEADNEIMRRAKEAYPDHPFFARMKEIKREIAEAGWLIAPPEEPRSGDPEAAEEEGA